MVRIQSWSYKTRCIFRFDVKQCGAMLLGIKALGVTFTDVIELTHQKTSLKKKIMAVKT